MQKKIITYIVDYSRKLVFKNKIQQKNFHHQKHHASKIKKGDLNP